MSARDAYRALRLQAANVLLDAKSSPTLPPLDGLAAALRGYFEDRRLLASLGLDEPEAPLALAARNFLTAAAASVGFKVLAGVYEDRSPGAFDGLVRGSNDAITATLLRLWQAVGTAPVSLAFDDEDDHGR